MQREQTFEGVGKVVSKVIYFLFDVTVLRFGKLIGMLCNTS